MNNELLNLYLPGDTFASDSHVYVIEAVYEDHAFLSITAVRDGSIRHRPYRFETLDSMILSGKVRYR